MQIFSLVFSTRSHTFIYLAWCYNRKTVIHSVFIMAEILLMRTKNKAICVIRNAQVKRYSNTINLWKHLISCIRRHEFRNEWMNGGWRNAPFCLHAYQSADDARCVFSLCRLSTWTHKYHLQLFGVSLEWMNEWMMHLYNLIKLLS